ncbi:methionine adenosyltransferase, partial [candidate division WOR-3 bacterium]|nr:methionine adenosyltransferase [candidate division WOR-3 bacterium]
AGLCREVEVRLAYVIGRADPTDVAVDTFGTGLVSDGQLVTLIRDVFPLRPREMIRYLGLAHPIYQPTSAYGHFGREPYTSKAGQSSGAGFFTWEKTNKASELRRILK